MPAPVDYAGRRFGLLLAVECVGSNKHGQRLWLCRCDCGGQTTVPGGALRSGNTKSCGCLVLKHGCAAPRDIGEALTTPVKPKCRR
jgi:hypothetical protein